MDALSSVLSLFKLKSSIYFKSAFPAGWGMNIPNGPFAQFHIVVKGHCLLKHLDSDEPQTLFPGDVVLFPHGSSHWLAHDRSSIRRSGQEIVKEINDDLVPFDGSEAGVTIICGHFEMDSDFMHPLLSSLPQIIHIPDSIKREYNWLENVCNIIIQETGSSMPGSSALTSRLAEVLFIQVLRVYTRMAKIENGYLAALNDPIINGALQAIHSNPGNSWTVDSLGRHVGVSRTLFANRFRHLVGMTPLSYLTDWRMLKAKELLKSGDVPLNLIADSVGYKSEASFIRVFRKKFDLTPGKFRRNYVSVAA